MFYVNIIPQQKIFKHKKVEVRLVEIQLLSMNVSQYIYINKIKSSRICQQQIRYSSVSMQTQLRESYVGFASTVQS